MSQVTSFGSGSTPPPGTYIQTIEGNIGGPVGPNGGGNLFLLGGTQGAFFDGNPGTNTINIGFNFLDLPVTDALGNGIIGFGAVRYIHQFGTDNLFIGANAGNFTLTTGDSNTMVGGGSGLDLTTGSSNTTLGWLSGANITTGSSNVFVGSLAGFGNAAGSTGDFNVSVGASSMLNITTAQDNTAVGATAGSLLTTGSDNIMLGATAGGVYTTESNNIALGNQGVAADSGVIRIGTNGTHTSSFITGIEGVDLTTLELVTVASDQLGSATLTAGTNITLSTATPNQIVISATPDLDLTYTAVNTTPYVVLADDQFLGVDSSGGAITVQLPNAPATGRVYVIKDATGSAATNNITVTTVGGVVLIDAAATFVMNTAYQSINVLFNGTQYLVY